MIKAECSELLDKIKDAYQTETGEKLDPKIVHDLIKEQREFLAKKFVQNRITHLNLIKTMKFEKFVSDVLQGAVVHPVPLPTAPILPTEKVVTKPVEQKRGRPIAKAPTHN